MIFIKSSNLDRDREEKNIGASGSCNNSNLSNTYLFVLEVYKRNPEFGLREPQKNLKPIIARKYRPQELVPMYFVESEFTIEFYSKNGIRKCAMSE